MSSQDFVSSCGCKSCRPTNEMKPFSGSVGWKHHNADIDALWESLWREIRSAASAVSLLVLSYCRLKYRE